MSLEVKMNRVKVEVAERTCHVDEIGPEADVSESVRDGAIVRLKHVQG